MKAHLIAHGTPLSQLTRRATAYSEREREFTFTFAKNDTIDYKLR